MYIHTKVLYHFTSKWVCIFLKLEKTSLFRKLNSSFVLLGVPFIYLFSKVVKFNILEMIRTILVLRHISQPVEENVFFDFKVQSRFLLQITLQTPFVQSP